MKEKEAICVYCASSALIDQSYIDAAFEMGAKIAKSGNAMVCGAGRTGLMGAVIDGTLSEGGKAIGVIPQFMVDNGWHHPQLKHLEVTPDMHTRKEMMARLSHTAIAMPGGCGTLEELLEIITWRQLGLYDGKIIILNVNNYFDPLLAMLHKAVEDGFMKKDHKDIWAVASTPDEAIAIALDDSKTLTLSSKY
ncbi:MAG: TIGR00730 family Rossman fold protein [Muribaculaceae bacterium]|nr:TIGR00730 family Rossman fold protein [Muribaculaceae bacterium]